MKNYTSDFETTTDIEDCRVWAFGICEVGNESFFEYGNNIDDFMNFCKLSNNSNFYFHNLKFDGTFIMIWLFENGYEHVIDRKELKSKTFSTLISDKGMFYSIKVVFEKEGKKTNTVTFYDSLKILPFSVSAIAKGFNLPISKLEIDYHAKREKGHILTKEEVEYVKNDVDIMARALHIMFEQNMTKMTQGSNALANYKRVVGEKQFDKWFPIPDYDHDVRQAYKGGWTYLNDKFKDIDNEEGIVLDVNSLYPWVMHDCPLPYGEGIYFEGEYQQDKLYSLYVQMITCQFELKENYLPTIQLKNNLAFVPTEYLKTSGDEEVTMCLTNIDLDLFFEHYHVYNITYHSGWKFKATTGLFTDYIDKWSKVKIESKHDGNKAMYLLAKLMLNALYGKFALNPNVQSKIPFYDNGMIKYRLGEKETRNPIYIPIGVFVTSHARYKTISSAQKVYERFMYADTDSLHLLGTDIPENLEVDDYKLGAWKHEGTFKRSRYLRQKSYIESMIVNDSEYEKMEDTDKEKCYIYKDTRVKDLVTCAGMPDSCKETVTWDNFRVGNSFGGKLQAKNVVGGVILLDIDFSIKK